MADGGTCSTLDGKSARLRTRRRDVAGTNQTSGCGYLINPQGKKKSCSLELPNACSLRCPLMSTCTNNSHREYAEVRGDRYSARTSGRSVGLIRSSPMTSTEVTLTLCGRFRDCSCASPPPGVGQGAGTLLRLAAQGHHLANPVLALQPAFGHRWLHWNHTTTKGSPPFILCLLKTRASKIKANVRGPIPGPSGGG